MKTTYAAIPLATAVTAPARKLSVLLRTTSLTVSTTTTSSATSTHSPNATVNRPSSFHQPCAGTQSLCRPYVGCRRCGAPIVPWP